MSSHKITAALLMAAGMGTRIRPLSEQTPKPLINVCGKPMIESLIQAIRQAGVENIYITLGYQKEKYYYLAEKYGNITFIENTEYKTKNTISSFHAAMELLGEQNCIVTESDLCVRDPSIFRGEIDKSRYFVLDSEPQDYEWGFLFSAQDRISAIAEPQQGRFLDHRMYGTAFWLGEDIRRIRDAVVEAYKHPGHENMCYDQAVNAIYDQLDVGVIRLHKGQIDEIDCIEDLIKVDPSYSGLLDHQA